MNFVKVTQLEPVYEKLAEGEKPEAIYGLWYTTNRKRAGWKEKAIAVINMDHVVLAEQYEGYTRVELLGSFSLEVKETPSQIMERAYGSR